MNKENVNGVYNLSEVLVYRDKLFKKHRKGNGARGRAQGPD